MFLPGWVVQAVMERIRREDLSGEDRLSSMARRTMQKEHGRACEIAGIDDHTIHDHRHTAAVHLHRVGIPLHLLQQQLGNARIDMTMRHARFHPDYGDVKAYFERVAEGLGLEESAPQNTPHS